MSPQELQKYFDSFINLEIYLQHVTPARFNLDRVRTLLDYLGSIHRTLPSLHVAGTNGKGSVCAFIASILQQAGYKVGLYTSPHLWDLTERIRILAPGGTMADFAGKISEEKLCRIVEAIYASVETVRERRDWGELTFFELLTVIALYYFHEQQVDFAVLETGLGGRLDATNVVHSEMCALTSIGMEHKNFLGDTIEKIAREKAAIIKDKSQSVIVAPQEPQAIAVIKSRCAEFGIAPVIVGDGIRIEGIRHSVEATEFRVKTKRNDYRLRTPLLGEHQAVNAAVAVGMAEALIERKTVIEKKCIEEGINRVSWPGRFEIVSRQPFIILDGAHNPPAAKILADALAKIFPKKKIVFVLGFSADKDSQGVCRELSPVAHEVVLTKSGHPRAAAPRAEDVAPLFPGKKISVIPDAAMSFQYAQTASGKDGIVVVTGSLFLISEIRKLCISIKV